MASKNVSETARAGVEAAHVAVETPQIERERLHFRELLLTNANYFGNLKTSVLSPVINWSPNQRYESIGCIGYQPQLGMLEAVVNINQTFGYGGGVCSAGSVEYVRFFVSYDNGTTWEDVGVGSFRVHDAASPVRGSAHLEFAVTKKFIPRRNVCFRNNTILVRGILSWSVMPPAGNEGYKPVWGSVRDVHVQVDPRRSLHLPELVNIVKIPPQFGQFLQGAGRTELAEPQVLGAAQLAEQYKDKKVEPHRFAFAEIQKALAVSGVSEPFAAPNSGLKALSADIVTAAGGAGGKEWLSNFGVDLPNLAELLAPSANTRYEQLGCIGYDEATSALVGVLRIKLSAGYSGGPCTAGSREFVSFWADTNNNGIFETFLGTTSVNVHDISPLPNDGLEFAVRLPVDFARFRQPCGNGPRIFKIRAILSWQTQPPAWNPDFMPVWGNRAEALILIKPGVVVPPGTTVPFLSAVGDIPSADINSVGTATGVAIETGFVASDSPFGGRITIAGHIANATAGLKYRVMKKPHGAPNSAFVPLNNSFRRTINTWNPSTGWVQTTAKANPLAPAVEGYFSFEDYSPNHNVESNLLGVFSTGIAEDGEQFDLRLDVSVDGNPSHDLHSDVVTVLIDNTPPEAAISLDLAPGVQCGHFEKGAKIKGSFSATDAHFGGFSFAIEPSGPPSFPSGGALPIPSSGSHGATIDAPPTALPFIGDPGVSNALYSLDTEPMSPCGYAIVLNVWDRTNVNSGQTHNYSKASVGFCLEEPE